MSTFLTAEWRKLILAQYEVQPSKLLEYLPRGVELDLFEDRCYVSMVGFLFDRVRLKGLAIPFHTRFEEVNLRFYVKRREQDGSVKRGVVFISELVPKPAIALVAKHFYEEPYTAVPTKHRIANSSSGLEVKYDWKFGGRWHSIAATAQPDPVAMAPGSVEEFITEHYWGYTKRSDGSTSAYEVRHPRWQVYPVKSYEMRADPGMLYGLNFENIGEIPVSSVILAEGSAVSVHSGFRITAA